MTDYAIRLEDVRVTAGMVTILDGITATVPKQSCTMIVGPNGAGKTTLLEAILGQVPYRGRILMGRGRSGGPPRIGYVPQKLAFDRGMPLTVAELLAASHQRRPVWFGLDRRLRARAAEMLDMVEARDLLDKPLGGLSGGEVQRVLVALAVVDDPDILVLDEPTAGMDVRGEEVFCGLIERLRHERRFTQLMVSHDLATVAHHATHVICLNRTLIAEGPPAQVLTPENRRAAFGVHAGMASVEMLRGTQDSSLSERGHSNA